MSKRNKQDFDDLERERAGRNDYRISRFFTAATADIQADEDENDQSFLGLWELSREIQKIMQRRIDEIQDAIDRALEESAERIRQAQEHVERIRQNAVKLEDGTAVYLAQDGLRAFDDHGRELTAAELEAIDWPEHAPTWEQRQAAGDELEAAINERQEIREYQERVNGHESRIDTLSPDELDDINRDLEAMPEAVRRQLEGPRPSITADGSQTFDRNLSEPFTAATLSPDELAEITPENGAQPTFTLDIKPR